MMRYLLALLVFLTCCSCGAMPLTPKGAIQSSEDATALVIGRDEDGTQSGLCTAVWVSAVDLLTAAHCAAGLAASANQEDVIGGRLEYLTRARYVAGDAQQDTEIGIVVAMDLENDLALISAHDRRHGIATLYGGAISKGDPVFTMGHTFGLPWSYSPGVVGAERRITKRSNGASVHVLQVFGSANHGDSGGGAFTETGELVGLGSFRIEDSSLLFYVHRDEIREFLHREASL